MPRKAKIDAPCALHHVIIKGIGRKIIENSDSFALREQQVSYQSISDDAIAVQPEDNTIYWQNGAERNIDSNMSLEASF